MGFPAGYGVFPQPVKPLLFSATCGTTEVVPCYKTAAFQPDTNFFAACKGPEFWPFSGG
jgi:hypothetical protein